MKAVFVGRFQPLHNGHLDALEYIEEEYDDIVFVIGSAQESGTKDNPWSADERKKILNEIFPDIPLYFLEDVPGDDKEWLENLNTLVGKYDALFSGNDWVLDVCRMYQVPCKKVKFNLDITGTAIREKLRAGLSVAEFVPPQVNEWIKKHPIT